MYAWNGISGLEPESSRGLAIKRQGLGTPAKISSTVLRAATSDIVMYFDIKLYESIIMREVDLEKMRKVVVREMVESIKRKFGKKEKKKEKNRHDTKGGGDWTKVEREKTT